MNVYELEQSFQILSNMLESEEIDEVVFNDTVESFPIEECAEQFAKMRKNFDAGIAALNEEITRLNGRKTSLKKAKEKANNTLLKLLSMRRGKIKTPMFTMYINKGLNVNVSDEELLPEKYIITKKEADTKAIKEAIKAGAEVPGAEIEIRESVTVR